MSESTKKYVVVFDELHKATGELTPGSPGSPPLAVVSVHHRGDTVDLDAETAKRHLEVGAVIAADDKRAKSIKPNDPLQGGVKRDPQLGPVALEQTEPAVAGGEGARRTATGGKLGTKAELAKLKVTELKALAAEHGVEVESGDDKNKLAAKLSKVTVAAADETALNPGQERDESPPPVHQPGDDDK